MKTPIAEQLQDAIRRKNWSIKETATAAGVDRFFLNRLVRGGDPPRTRSGRHTAEHDERYHQISRALDLEVEEFIADVRQMQLGETEEKGDLVDRYPEFQSLLRTHLPIRTEKEILKLLRAALEDLSPQRAEDLFEQVSSSLSEMARSALIPSRPRTPDFLGWSSSESPLDRLKTKNRRLCNRIGDALVRLGDIETSGDRVRLAALFYEVAPSVVEPAK